MLEKLELLGAIFSILGAILIGIATKEMLYRAFCAFFISNLALFTFFLLEGKVPMLIQMAMFFWSAVLGIYRLSSQQKRDKTIIIFLLSVYVVVLAILLLNIGISNISFEIKLIDVVASAMAIYGSFLLSSDNKTKRNIAYILFLLADILFVYIGYTNGFYFFMFQSAVFIFTSSAGLYNTNRKQALC